MSAPTMDGPVGIYGPHPADRVVAHDGSWKCYVCTAIWHSREALPSICDPKRTVLPSEPGPPERPRPRAVAGATLRQLYDDAVERQRAADAVILAQQVIRDVAIREQERFLASLRAAGLDVPTLPSVGDDDFEAAVRAARE